MSTIVLLHKLLNNFSQKSKQQKDQQFTSLMQQLVAIEGIGDAQKQRYKLTVLFPNIEDRIAYLNARIQQAYASGESYPTPVFDACLFKLPFYCHSENYDEQSKNKLAVWSDLIIQNLKNKATLDTYLYLLPYSWLLQNVFDISNDNSPNASSTNKTEKLLNHDLSKKTKKSSDSDDDYTSDEDRVYDWHEEQKQWHEQEKQANNKKMLSQQKHLRDLVNLAYDCEDNSALSQSNDINSSTLEFKNIWGLMDGKYPLIKTDYSNNQPTDELFLDLLLYALYQKVWQFHTKHKAQTRLLSTISRSEEKLSNNPSNEQSQIIPDQESSSLNQKILHAFKKIRSKKYDSKTVLHSILLELASLKIELPQEPSEPIKTLSQFITTMTYLLGYKNIKQIHKKLTASQKIDDIKQKLEKTLEDVEQAKQEILASKFFYRHPILSMIDNLNTELVYTQHFARMKLARLVNIDFAQQLDAYSASKPVDNYKIDVSVINSRTKLAITHVQSSTISKLLDELLPKNLTMQQWLVQHRSELGLTINLNDDGSLAMAIPSKQKLSVFFASSIKQERLNDYLFLLILQKLYQHKTNNDNSFVSISMFMKNFRLYFINYWQSKKVFLQPNNLLDKINSWYEQVLKLLAACAPLERLSHTLNNKVHEVLKTYCDKNNITYDHDTVELKSIIRLVDNYIKASNTAIDTSKDDTSSEIAEVLEQDIKKRLHISYSATDPDDLHIFTVNHAMVKQEIAQKEQQHAQTIKQQDLKNAQYLLKLLLKTDYILFLPHRITRQDVEKTLSQFFKKNDAVDSLVNATDTLSEQSKTFRQKAEQMNRSGCTVS